jgi:hypothetical protein
VAAVAAVAAVVAAVDTGDVVQAWFARCRRYGRLVFRGTVPSCYGDTEGKIAV